VESESCRTHGRPEEEKRRNTEIKGRNTEYEVTGIDNEDSE
jgi:hypothetical protein